ncbi:hypothetical protein BJV77DRAFT_962656 [Russula vinacea]|nr:hypothetical protein BJV77DRAFT_962656 [Russula vinacea]
MRLRTPRHPTIPDEFTRVLCKHPPKIKLHHSMRLRSPGYQTINNALSTLSTYWQYTYVLPAITDELSSATTFISARAARSSWVFQPCSRPLVECYASALPRSSCPIQYIYVPPLNLQAPTGPQPPVVPHWHVRQDVVDTSPVRDASTDPIAPQLVSRCVLSQNPVAQIEAPNACPNCKRNFNRRQELKRHLRSNLPHWIHCPTSQCGWTGNRLYSLKKHMTAHPQGGLAPRPGEYQIYNPEELVESMARGTLSFGSAAAIALSMVDARVDERFAQPYKVGVISNAWNRGRRKFCKARN